MTPTAAALLTKAHTCLANARAIAAIGLSDVAAREAYLAAYHAAQAFVVETTGHSPKTHSGVRQMFGKLIIRHGLDQRLGRFLSQAYEYKVIADYDTMRHIPPDTIPEIMDRAEQMIGVIETTINTQE